MCRSRGSFRPGRAFQGVTEALGARPWQTTSELTATLGYHAGKTLDRLRRKGLVVRRIGDRRLAPYEYALRAAGKVAA